jgi:hypothetical protein
MSPGGEFLQDSCKGQGLVSGVSENPVAAVDVVHQNHQGALSHNHKEKGTRSARPFVDSLAILPTLPLLRDRDRRGAHRHQSCRLYH